MFSTLRTLIRASSEEADEAIKDANAPRLMAQHLRDARADLARGRGTLASLIALERQEAREEAEAAKEAERREAEAQEAYIVGSDSLGDELSERILDLEDRRNRAAGARNEISERIEKLRDHLRQVEQRITRLGEELRLARMMEPARTAMSAVPLRSDALADAEGMAARMRERALENETRIEAMADPRNDTRSDLDSRLREAGISNERTERRAALRARLNSTTNT